MPRFVLSLIFWITALSVSAQTAGRDGYTWEQFVEDYLLYVTEEANESDNDVVRHDWLEDLEPLRDHPIDINTAERQELLDLHFLSDTQIDSLLAKRNRLRGGFRSLGELMTVRELSYRDRAWLSLLVEFKPLAETSPVVYPTRQKEATAQSGTANPYRQKKETGRSSNRWYGGTHEISATFDVPLYRRAGFDEAGADESEDYALSHEFLGRNFAHTLRYRYSWHQRVMYSATVQQDVGEPFGSYGARTWDFGSLSFYYRSDPMKERGTTFQRYEVVAGDYKAAFGQGLLLGYGGWNVRSSSMTGLRKETTRLRPHTGTDESRFLRGAAATFRMGRAGQWALTALGSWRQLDGTVKGAVKTNFYDPAASDTITAWKTDGLHRTYQEEAKRHVATQLLAGLRFGYQGAHFAIGANAIGVHYDKVYWPASRSYNANYLHGRDAAAISADYSVWFSQWSLQGEVALSKPSNGASQSEAYASTWALRWTPVRALSLMLQQRSFGKAYVTPYGQTLQAGSQLQNEHGIMLGASYRGIRRILLSAYADWAFHPAAVYLADTASRRVEVMLEASLRANEHWTHTLRYKVKGRQQNVTGYRDLSYLDGVLLAWRNTQHLRWQSVWTDRQWSVAAGADLSCFYSQGTSVSKEGVIDSGTSWGGLLFLRAAVTPIAPLRVQAMAAAFRTEDYNARCYATLPMLRGTIAAPSFSGEGVTGALLAEWHAFKSFTLSCRITTVRYFDRDVISSGINEISSPWKNDISFQCRYKF